MMELSPLVPALRAAVDLVKDLDALIRRARGRKRMVLLELRSNVNLVRLFFEAETPIDRVVAKLKTDHLGQALESDFSFRSIKGRRVSAETVGGAAQLKPYVGWSTERLCEQIYLKIRELKDIVEIDPDNPKVRKSVRLSNLLKLMLLLLRHVAN